MERNLFRVSSATPHPRPAGSWKFNLTLFETSSPLRFENSAIGEGVGCPRHGSTRVWGKPRGIAKTRLKLEQLSCLQRAVKLAKWPYIKWS